MRINYIQTISIVVWGYKHKINAMDLICMHSYCNYAKRKSRFCWLVGMLNVMNTYQLLSLEPRHSEHTVCAGMLELDPLAEAAAPSMATELCVAGLFQGVCKCWPKSFNKSVLCNFTQALGIIAAFLHEEQALSWGSSYLEVQNLHLWMKTSWRDQNCLLPLFFCI